MVIEARRAAALQSGHIDVMAMQPELDEAVGDFADGADRGGYRKMIDASKGLTAQPASMSVNARLFAERGMVPETRDVDVIPVSACKDGSPAVPEDLMNYLKAIEKRFSKKDGAFLAGVTIGLYLQALLEMDKDEENAKDKCREDVRRKISPQIIAKADVYVRAFESADGDEAREEVKKEFKKVEVIRVGSKREGYRVTFNC